MDKILGLKVRTILRLPFLQNPKKPVENL